MEFVIVIVRLKIMFELEFISMFHVSLKIYHVLKPGILIAKFLNRRIAVIYYQR